MYDESCDLLTIHEPAFFAQLATRGKLGLGESYTVEEWDADDLVALFEFLLRNADAAAEQHRCARRLLELRPRLHRRNGSTRSRRNIAYHYDLGCRITGITISREQATLARERTRGLPVEILEQDYPTVEGRYTKVSYVFRAA